jgi:hypothetical protein
VTRREDPAQYGIFVAVSDALTDAQRWGVQLHMARTDLARWRRRLDLWRPGMKPSRSRLSKRVDECVAWVEDAHRRHAAAIAQALAEGATVEQLQVVERDVQLFAGRSTDGGFTASREGYDL